MTDAVVIGGGIVGAAAAAFLAEAGATVTLFERAGLASGASGANSGIVQHPMDPALVPLYRRTVQLYRELSRAEAGFRLADEPAGMLFVSRERAAADGIAASFPHLATEILEGRDLATLEPALAPDLVGCRVPIGYPIPPSASTYGYATVAERRGVTVRSGRAATPTIKAGRVTGVTVDGQLVSADQVLVAAGPWTPDVVDPSGRWRPIRALWGVVVELELAPPPRFVLEEAEIDAVIGPAGGISGPDPRPSFDFSLVTAAGVSSVGSTFLDDEPDPADWIVPLLTRARGFVPAVDAAPIRGVRACARPISLDGRPLIGAIPGIDGLFVCAGHGPWGISTGPASAELVVDRMLGRDVDIAPELDAARFGAP